MPAEANAKGGITGNDSALGTYLTYPNKHLSLLVIKIFWGQIRGFWKMLTESKNTNALFKKW